MHFSTCCRPFRIRDASHPLLYPQRELRVGQTDRLRACGSATSYPAALPSDPSTPADPSAPCEYLSLGMSFLAGGAPPSATSSTSPPPWSGARPASAPSFDSCTDGFRLPLDAGVSIGPIRDAGGD